MEEALANLTEALKLYVEDALPIDALSRSSLLSRCGSRREPRAALLSGSAVVYALQGAGFASMSTRGSHHRWQPPQASPRRRQDRDRAASPQTCTWTLHSILRQAGMSAGELMALLED